VYARTQKRQCHKGNEIGEPKVKVSTVTKGKGKRSLIGLGGATLSADGQEKKKGKPALGTQTQR